MKLLNIKSAQDVGDYTISFEINGVLDEWNYYDLPFDLAIKEWESDCEKLCRYPFEVYPTLANDETAKYINSDYTIENVRRGIIIVHYADGSDDEFKIVKIERSAT